MDVIQYAKKQKVKGYSAQAEAVNGKIGAIKARTLKIYNELSGFASLRENFSRQVAKTQRKEIK